MNGGRERTEAESRAFLERRASGDEGHSDPIRDGRGGARAAIA
jgi:hypothetical protein